MARVRDFPDATNEYDSVTGVGKRIPDGNGTLKLANMYVPSGETITHPLMSDNDLEHPYHNEYIVFDPTRILIKYIVKIEWY